MVASQYPISVAGSIRLAQVLYRELLSATGSLEQAVLAARHSLARDASQIDWASLQLYSRASDPVFLPPSYLLRSPSAALEAVVMPTGSADKLTVPQREAAPKSIDITVSRRSLLISGIAQVGLLVASSLLYAAWPEGPDEGPIVLDNGRCLSLDQTDFETKQNGGEVQQLVRLASRSKYCVPCDAAHEPQDSSYSMMTERYPRTVNPRLPWRGQRPAGGRAKLRPRRQGLPPPGSASRAKPTA